MRRIGKMTLNRNPDNFFAETEQVAFHPGHLVPGIDFTNDPLLQGRLFSYLDTQLTRLGGPNFAEIPINRSVAPVHNNQRDGFHAPARSTTAAPATIPNSLGGGCPFQAGSGRAASCSYAGAVDGPEDPRAQRELPRPLQPGDAVLEQPVGREKEHIVDAARFELGKVESPLVRERMVALLDLVDRDLATRVAEQIGVLPPTVAPKEIVDAAGQPMRRCTARSAQTMQSNARRPSAWRTR